MPRPQYVEPFGYYSPCGYIEYDCIGETVFVVPEGGFRYEVPKPDVGFVVVPIIPDWLLRPLDATFTVPAPGLRFTVPVAGFRFTVPARPRTFSLPPVPAFVVRPRGLRYTVIIDRRYTVAPGGFRFVVSMEDGMTTGAFWNIDAPNRPWGPLDQNGSVLPIPLDWERWLAEIGEGYFSHEFTPDPALEVVTERVEGGVIYFKIKFRTPPVLGQYYPVLCHIVTDATPPTEEDQTLWFKAVSK